VGFGAALAAARGVLSRADFQLHVDINVGDPIWPDAEETRLPRLLEGDLCVRGYSLELVLAGNALKTESYEVNSVATRPTIQ
jgi:hypothetical protein